MQVMWVKTKAEIQMFYYAQKGLKKKRKKITIAM